MEGHLMMNPECFRLDRRALLASAAVATAAMARGTRPTEAATAAITTATVEQNTHTWHLPYPPGLSGSLTERGALFYNGRTPEDSSLSRFPFKGGVVLEADWNGKVPFFAAPSDTPGSQVFRALRYSAEPIARAKATAQGWT